MVQWSDVRSPDCRDRDADQAEPDLRRHHRSGLAGRAGGGASFLQHVSPVAFSSRIRFISCAPSALLMAVAWLVQLIDRAFARTPSNAALSGRRVRCWQDAARAAHAGACRQLPDQHRAFAGPADQLLRLVRAPAGHPHVSFLRRHLRRGVDAPALATPGQPHPARDHHHLPANCHLRRHPERGAGSAALGRRRARSRRRQHGQRDLRRRLPDHRRVPDARAAVQQRGEPDALGRQRHRRCAALGRLSLRARPCN